MSGPRDPTYMVCRICDACGGLETPSQTLVTTGAALTWDCDACNRSSPRAQFEPNAALPNDLLNQVERMDTARKGVGSAVLILQFGDDTIVTARGAAGRRLRLYAQGVPRG